jgi:hypothetical protein
LKIYHEVRNWLREVIDVYIQKNVGKDVPQQEAEQDCYASQFYGFVEPILSKIWDNPEDEIYNDK